MSEDDKSLVLLGEADKALALAITVPELKDLRDTFTAAKAWAKSRGLGVESENKASEYILRTERKIGAELIRMLESGERRGEGGTGSNQFKSNSPGDGQLLPPDVAALGIERHAASDWQTVARVPDDEFEALLDHAKVARERIAKINFYRTSHKRAGDGSPETKPDKGFEMFRAGAYHLLGWRVDDNGLGAPTTNGLKTLPRDELVSFAEIIKLLVAAYNEVREARQ
jgi:hypothetical protein